MTKILIIALHLAILLLWVIFLLEKLEKNMLSLMCFYHILHRNSIGNLLRIPRNYFRPPPPQSCRMLLANIYVHFRRVFVEFVVLLTKICTTNIDF